MKHSLALAMLLAAATVAAEAADFRPAPDRPFVQEYRDEIAYPQIENANQARAIAADGDGGAWLATKAGVFHFAAGAWTEALKGSTYALAVHGDTVWAGTWHGLYRIQAGRAEQVEAVPPAPIVAVLADTGGVVAISHVALYEWDGAKWLSSPWTGAKSVRSIARDSAGGLWIATGMGAYYKLGATVREVYKEIDLLAGDLRAVAIAPGGDVWLGSIGGLDVYRDGRRVAQWSTANGLPNQDIHALAAEPDGTVWAGTALGAVRRIGARWSLRYSRRWLPSDDVRAIAVAGDHTVWVATTGGLSAIHRRQMTLSEKADQYLKTCLERHVRAPYLVEQCDLKAPGDTAHFTPRDDDNEGGYTGMYLAMESFRYAVTKDPQALDNARKAFRAMKFLQEITGTSGFFARTVVPSDWPKIHDGNETFSPEQRADRLVENPRDKPLENRWRRSADGKWLWKGDTSSDETSMHFYGYFVYYTVAADEAERAIICDHVRRIVDHMIEGGPHLPRHRRKTDAVGRLGAGEAKWRPGLARRTLVKRPGDPRLPAARRNDDRRPEVPPRGAPTAGAASLRPVRQPSFGNRAFRAHAFRRRTRRGGLAPGAYRTASRATAHLRRGARLLVGSRSRANEAAVQFPLGRASETSCRKRVCSGPMCRRATRRTTRLGAMDRRQPEARRRAAGP